MPEVRDYYFNLLKELCEKYDGKGSTIKTPSFISSRNFLLYNFYTFLLLYSGLKGKWSNFKDTLKEISHLLWDSGYGLLAYSLFTPVKDNKEWNYLYLNGVVRNSHNDEFHKRELSADVLCPVCGLKISTINIKKHMNGKNCHKLVESPT